MKNCWPQKPIICEMLCVGATDGSLHCNYYSSFFQTIKVCFSDGCHLPHYVSIPSLAIIITASLTCDDEDVIFNVAWVALNNEMILTFDFHGLTTQYIWQCLSCLLLLFTFEFTYVASLRISSTWNESIHFNFHLKYLLQLIWK